MSSFRRKKLLPLLVLSVLLCSSAGLAVTIFDEIFGANMNDEFGQAVACAKNRVAVGIPSFDTMFPESGRVEIYRPAAGLANFVPLMFPVGTDPSQMNARFGSAIHFVDHFVGDPQDEILVGAPGYATGQGAIYLFSDEASPAILQSSGSFSFERFGRAVTSINGIGTNGAPALVGGADISPDGGFRVIDAVDGMPLAEATPFPGFAGFAEALTSISDLDTDTFDDLAVGALEHENSFGQEVGAVQIFSLNDGAIFLNTIEGTVEDQDFGAALARVGDMTGDGVDELLVGAPAETEGTATAGGAYLFSGASLLETSPTPLCILTAPAGNLTFGSAVAGIGDVNGDGVLDFAVGNPGGSADAGSVQIYTYTGSCQLLEMLTGSAVGQQFGRALGGNPNPISGAGCEISADASHDFVIGTRSDQAAANAGSVVIALGGAPTPTPTPTPTLDPGLPLGSELTFKISKEGNFIARVTYNTLPSEPCRVHLYGRMVVQGQRGIVREIADTDVTAEVIEFRVRDLPPAARPDGVEPQLHAVAVTQCGGPGALISNVFARLANCRDSGELLAPQWFSVLVGRFRERLQSVSSLGTQRKIIRGKPRRRVRRSRR